MTAIEVTGVGRAFGAVPAVRDATFTVEEGAITGLIGPNGAGKTTLFLMLASLLAPDRGTIRIAGADPTTDPSAVRSRIGWMPDALGAWPSLTVRESIIATARLYDMTPVRAAVRADELLGIVGLGDLAGARAKVLSRGQKQKLGLARALVHDPSVLLLDEPASGLDPAARVQLRELLRGLAAEGRTVLISSHILSELDEIVDDAVFLIDGATVTRDPETATQRPWRIRVVGGVDAVQGIGAALGIDPAVLRHDRDGVQVSFAGEEHAAQGLRQLIEAGIAVSEFGPAQGRLEHAFLSLAPGSEGGDRS